MKFKLYNRTDKYPVLEMTLYFLLAVVLIAADQISKIYVMTHYRNADFPLLGDFLHLFYAENTGAAFSRFQGHMLWLVAATAIMVIVCLFLLFTRRLEGRAGQIALALIVAGGVGNLIDRVYRGYVVDFLYPKFINFAIFNVADCCVVCGAILLGIYLILHEKEIAHKGNQSEQL